VTERLGEDGVEVHAGHLGGVLHDEVETGDGALPRRHGQDVLAVEQHRPAEHLVAGLAHDDGRQRALAGAVGTHDRVDLARPDGEIDPVEDLLAGDRGEVADLERAHD
jgi:hypothetical protein